MTKGKKIREKIQKTLVLVVHNKQGISAYSLASTINCWRQSMETLLSRACISFYIHILKSYWWKHIKVLTKLIWNKGGYFKIGTNDTYTCSRLQLSEAWEKKQEVTFRAFFRQQAFFISIRTKGNSSTVQKRNQKKNTWKIIKW